jgi:hypothetical protein
MASEPSVFSSAASLPSGRTAGLLMGAASLLTVVFMAFHPTVHARNTEELFAGIDKTAFVNRVVHGSLIALQVLLVVAFSSLASRLGLGSILVRTGFVTYVTGALAMSAAALINGLILTDFVARYESQTKATMDSAKHVMAYGFAANQICSKAGVLAMSIAVALWSIGLLFRGAGVRAVGVFGCIAGIIPAAALLSGYLHMDVHGMLAFVFAQTVWSLAVAWLMVRGRI